MRDERHIRIRLDGRNVLHLAVLFDRELMSAVLVLSPDVPLLLLKKFVWRETNHNEEPFFSVLFDVDEIQMVSVRDWKGTFQTESLQRNVLVELFFDAGESHQRIVVRNLVVVQDYLLDVFQSGRNQTSGSSYYKHLIIEFLYLVVQSLLNRLPLELLFPRVILQGFVVLLVEVNRGAIIVHFLFQSHLLLHEVVRPALKTLLWLHTAVFPVGAHFLR